MWSRTASTILLLTSLACGDDAGTTPIGPGSPPPPPPPPGSADFSVVASTFLGGSQEDQVRGLAIAPDGGVIAVGTSWSSDFPTTSGAWDRSMSGGNDAFIVRFGPSGNVIWSTFLGGSRRDFGMTVALGPSGDIYVGGYTGGDFPVSGGAAQTTFGGGEFDGFVCRFSMEGQRRFCTYVGSDGRDILRDLVVDSNGDIVVAPASESGSFPQSWFAGTFQPTRPGGRDHLLAKLSGDGSSVRWATFIGGPGVEQTESLALGADGSIFIALTTLDGGLPTPGGFDGSMSGPSDLYVARIASDGSNLIFGTYLGGSGEERSEEHHIAVDADGSVVVASLTSSDDFPVTGGTLSGTLGGTSGEADGFIARISASGQLQAATYLGGVAFDRVGGVALDAAGNVHVAGLTFSSDFPVTADAPQGTLVGQSDAFATVVSADLRSLLFSTYVGGNDDDAGREVAVRGSRTVLAGQTTSTNWPTQHASQGSYGGGSNDGFAMIIDESG